MAIIAFCGAIESIEDITKMENPENKIIRILPRILRWVVSPFFPQHTFLHPPNN